MFFLVEDTVREDILHGFFKNETLFKAPQLQRRGDASGKLSQLEIEQRKSRAYACHFRGAEHFAVIVVRQSHFDVEVKQAVQIVICRSGTKVFFGDVQPGFRRSALQQTWFKHFLRWSAQQKLVRHNAPRERNVGAPDITPRQTETALILREQRGDRFDESLAEEGWDILVKREAFVSRVTLIACEEFVTSVAREQCRHAGFPRHAGAVVGADGGRVREGLVVILHDFRYSIVGIPRSKAEFVMVGAEMFCRSAGKPNFAVNRLSKENRVGVDRRVALVHEGNDAAAVSAAAQVGTSLFRSEIRQMMLDRRAYPFADFASPVSRRSEEHTSELQSQSNLVCRLLLEKKKKKTTILVFCYYCRHI